MKTKFRALSLCLMLVPYFLVTESSGMDVAGSQLTYQYLSGDTFRFQFVFYRDCYGTPPPTVIDLHVASVSCGVSQTYTMTRLICDEMTNVCATAQTVCTGGSIQGIQKCIYETEAVLANHCSDWVFSSTKCCFSPVITTILNPAVYESFAEARLNNLNGNNSSPQFTNEPVISICMNQDFHYNNGAVDPDGDSLAYILSGLMVATNTIAVYTPGYDFLHPVSSSPLVNFDSFSGDVFIHPTAIEAGMMSYTVMEYRNGLLVGIVTRSILIETGPCANTNPVATGMNGTPQQVIYVLPGTVLCFDIFSNDPDSGQLLTMEWNQAIPAATFTTAGSPHPTGTFCWTPSLADLRPQPYSFTASIEDDNCPYTGVGVYSYFIYVTLDSSLVNVDAIQEGFISISPNPSTGIFSIRGKEKFVCMEIYNHSGSCIMKKDLETSVDLSDQPTGIYLIKVIYADGTTAVQKIIKASGKD